VWERRVNFTNLKANRQWFIQGYNMLTDQMMEPYVFYYRQGIRHDISAEQGFYRDGSWIFTNAQELVFSGAPEPTRTETRVRVMKEFDETPDQIRSQIKVNKMGESLRAATKTQLTISEILNYLQWHPEASPRRAMLETKLYGRIAAPWTCLVVVLIALPFGARTGRGNVFVGVASSILICFCYYVLQQLSLALGSGGYLLPLLAAWLPNLLFAATGIFLTWKAR
jgi:lipopolysaccharide export system permease protein